uniref:Uncharacterized protein n=1 Tax=Glossina pallidipes TaxID=7398 RepID=A0A1A9ZXD0_GLOPL
MPAKVLSVAVGMQHSTVMNTPGVGLNNSKKETISLNFSLISFVPNLVILSECLAKSGLTKSSHCCWMNAVMVWCDYGMIMNSENEASAEVWTSTESRNEAPSGATTLKVDENTDQRIFLRTAKIITCRTTTAIKCFQE